MVRILPVSMAPMFTVYLTKKVCAEAVIRALGKKKGIDTSEMKGVDFQTFKETQYDILAAALREHLDMKAIYEILEAGV